MRTRNCETAYFNSNCRIEPELPYGSRATGNSRFEGEKFPVLFWKNPENSRLELMTYIGPIYKHTPQSALEFCPIHCPNGRLGQDLGFGGIAFALKLPELLNRNLAAIRPRAKLGQTFCFPNGPKIWCPIGQ